MKTEKIIGNKKVTTEEMMFNAKGEYLWLFNFVGGGFNNVWAKTKEEAIVRAKKEFSMPVQESTFVAATVEAARQQDRMGWMMSI